jgi:hypothetical protein
MTYQSSINVTIVAGQFGASRNDKDLYMSVLDWSGVAASVTATLVVFVGFTRWVIKAYLAELKPNGGESLSDKIKLEILPMLTEIKSDLAEMKGRLDQHLTEGDKPKTRKRAK